MSQPSGQRLPLLQVKEGGDESYSSLTTFSDEDDDYPSRLSRLLLPSPRSLTGEFIDFTHSASAIQICFLFLAVYLLLGTIIFSFIFDEFTIIDSLYFAVVTVTTCGYGDLHPLNEIEQLFTVFFILVGVTVLGVGLGIIGENLVEAQERAFTKPARIQDAENRLLHMFGQDSETPPPPGGNAGTTEQENEDEGDLFDWEDAKGFLLHMGPMVATIIVLSLVIGHFEEWSLVQSIYFCVVSTTTVGYGDVAPETQGMRLLVVFFLPLAVAATASFLGRIAGIYMEWKAKQVEKDFLKRELTLSDIAVMDSDSNGGVSYGEFLSFMLVAMQKVDKADVDRLKKLFRSLDADNSGELMKEDLILLARRKKNAAKTP